ncbi:MAG: hypothetical protein SFV32_14205 [Opitutaceae bacterium]|nr:hypothetical protein [Opitutaceae bacterium]
MNASHSATGPRRLFSDESYWNRPLAPEPSVHPRNAEWIDLLNREPTGFGFGVNARSYTIPVYVVNENTPRQVIRWIGEYPEGTEGRPEGNLVLSIYHHPKVYGTPVPIPVNLVPSPGTDRHVVIVDYDLGLMWDAWYMQRMPDGNWASNTLMLTDLNGSGVYTHQEVHSVIDGVEKYIGPGRAAGVPVAAGLIMYDEVMSGRIRHKLAGAIRFVALGEHVHPPAWSNDGALEGGIPEGAQLQLDPDLDLSQFDLTKEELTVAKAMQEYGIVLVDFAAATTTYAEGLWYDSSRSWEGKLRDWDEPGGLKTIPINHYRVIDFGETRKGSRIRPPHHIEGLLEAGIRVEAGECEK